MQTSLQITFRGVPTSEAMEARIRDKVTKLERYCENILACRVMVEPQHRHHHKGKLYHVRIDLSVPDHELVVSREPEKNRAHEDAYVAIRDAFEAMKRQLEAYAARRKRQVKAHPLPPQGRVAELDDYQGFGRLETVDGREIYFHRNSVVGIGFEELEVGKPVVFVESHGDLGPQASAVRPLGKYHLVS